MRLRCRLLRRFAPDRRAAPRPYPAIDYPALEPRHLADARLFANRDTMITALPLPPRGAIAEVGVAHGDFSEFLLRQLAPDKFVAFDLFNLHQWPSAWGRDTRELLGGMNHLDFYRRRFAERGGQVVAEPGPSHLGLAKYPDRSFDLIYIDAAHDYEGVRRDAELALDKVKLGGFLVFNDYIMYDHLAGVPYGVVPVVNRLVVERGLAVFGFALERHLFCDIALRAPAG